MTLREKIRPLCDALVRGQRVILGERLFGVYVFGAVTFPETTATGDVDFHALLREPPSKRQVDDLHTLHDEMACRFPPYGVDLDGYYLLLAEVMKGAVPPRHQLRKDLRDDSFALHCAHLRAGRCMVLYGPDPVTVYPEPTWEDLETALAGELDYVARHLSEYPDYCVLNLCRLIHSHRTRDVVVSKFGAAAWAVETYPDWRTLIEGAEASYTGRATTEDRQVLQERVPALYEFAVEEIARAQSSE